MYEGEYVRSALAEGLARRGVARREPLRVRIDREHRLAYGPRDRRRRRFLGQVQQQRAGPRPRGRALGEELPAARRQRGSSPVPGRGIRWSRDRSSRHDDLAPGRLGLRRSLGEARTRARRSSTRCKRRETYATTGPRIVVRFFGGWSFGAGRVRAGSRRPWAMRRAFRWGACCRSAEGIGAGGSGANEADDAPSFLVSALRDPDGANLDRVQIVKQWLDDAGARHERIFDVALSGERKVGRDGRSRQPVGRYGRPRDGDLFEHDRGEPADDGLARSGLRPERAARSTTCACSRFPRPHWTTYDAVRFGRARDDQHPGTTQERAYTSPIWYRAN